MKNYFRFGYMIATVVLVVGSVMQIMHKPMASEIKTVGVMLGIIVLVLENSKLKQRIKQLQNNQ